MSTANSRVTTKQVLTTAKSEAERLLEAVFRNIRSVSEPSAGGEPPRLFFPNGIEIIYVEVEAYFTDKIRGTVKVKIAGEKGLKALEVESAAKV